MVTPVPAPGDPRAGRHADRGADRRAQLHDVTEAFLALVSAVPDDAWERPGLGVWTVRELVGHTGRALATVEDYVTVALASPAALASPTADPSLPDAVTYFRIAGDLGLTNSSGVADRGREAGRELGARPLDTLTDLARRALALLDEAPDDLLTTTRFGSIRLVDYLPTRTFELVVHGLDLASALSVPWPVPQRPLESALGLATALAVERGLGPQVLLALSGRHPLPESFCVL